MSQVLLRRAAGAKFPERDPYWTNVVSLLHFDGPNGSTGFVDAKGKIWSNLGSPVIRTDQSLFGGSSGYFVASAIESVSSPDWAFGTGDFTVEFWMRNNELGTGGFYDSPVGNWAANLGWCFFVRPDGTLQFQTNGTAVASAAGVVAATTDIRVSASRAAGTLRIFAGGSLVASAANTENLSVQQSPRVGSNRAGASDDFEGWIDELRVTKGVGRYTANYTLPAAPFPDM